jgi:flagellar biosynthetic protein FlhB
MAEENDQDGGEKTEEPSAHRIEEFRKKGDVASSKELTGVLVLATSFLVLSLSMIYTYETMTGFIEWLYMQNAEKMYEPKMTEMLIREVFIVVGKCMGPIMLAVLCVGIVANVMQFGFLFSSEILNIDPERINPINGFKKLFSTKSLVEALKAVFKFIIIMSIVYILLKDELTSYSGFFHLEFFQGFLQAKTIITKLGFSVVLGMLVLAIGDFAYQKFSYRQKIMLTKEQAKKEAKEHDGNPEIKQRIRSVQRAMAQKRMIEDVKKSDVIVTNPTHLSVALKYDSETMASPVVMAKGGDHLAMRIREIAKANNIPLVENIPLARALYKTVPVGDTVPRNLYKTVAEVLAFVYKLRRKEKALEAGL